MISMERRSGGAELKGSAPISRTTILNLNRLDANKESDLGKKQSWSNVVSPKRFLYLRSQTTITAQKLRAEEAIHEKSRDGSTGGKH